MSIAAVSVHGVMMSVMDSTHRYRLNQLDFRLAKIVRISRVRLQGQVELFNMFNGSPALLVNNNYSAGPAGWQRPTQINQGRLVKFGMQLQF